MPTCCVVGCSNRRGHKFPSDNELKSLWLLALNRVGFQPAKLSIVCSEHFTSDDYVLEGYNTGLPLTKKRLKKGAVPSVFSPTPKKDTKRRVEESSSVDVEKERLSSCPGSEEDKYDEEEESCLSENSLKNPSSPDDSDNSSVPYMNVEVILSTEEETEFKVPEITKTRIKSHNKGTQFRNDLLPICIQRYKSNNDALAFFTGLDSFEKFKLLFSTLSPECYSVNYRSSAVLSLCAEDQFFLFLVKLKRNTCNFELGLHFEVSDVTAGNVFVTWVNFVSDIWEDLDFWPSEQLIERYMPKSFRKKSPKVRLVSDGTETPGDKPPCLESDNSNAPLRKKRKIDHIAVSPAGLTIKSEALTETTCDIPVLGKGNTVSSTEPDGVSTDHHTMDNSDTSESNQWEDAKPSRKRDLTERLVRQTRTYKILQSELNNHYLPLATKIFSICWALCYFKECIINRDV